MKIVKNKEGVREAVAAAKAVGKRVGFVPTMGGLHEGHLSLVRQSLRDCDYTVVSIFLNPTQFNNPDDLATYPHNDEEDIALLQGIGADLLFMPSAEEMYEPGEEAPKLPLGRVAEVMEGAYRPGHFQGVVWVLGKLFRLIEPDVAYFGLKDFQQIAVVRRMVELSDDMSVEIVACPVVREADGLAMSSRNRRLTAEERAVAPLIYKALQAGKEAKERGLSVREVQMKVTQMINSEPLLSVEYFSIVDGSTLEDITEWVEDSVGCITVFCGEVRLIDHIAF